MANIYIINTDLTTPAVSRVFSYEAEYYSLGEYEKIVPGAQERLMRLYVFELEQLRRIKTAKDAIQCAQKKRTNLGTAVREYISWLSLKIEKSLSRP
jgi:hypothetical protein